ncbi:hypothetical protein THRCLA_07889 [Thraustotheca clavata]|uniref:Uncharacterized protein n=1 Tax=Thraustotheca clavata TaxID=74557 RepID=A0A1V9ZBP8_9STRA|nr:hypothetical protein THRCLA_07889 [Thraustotheca clavata]
MDTSEALTSFISQVVEAIELNASIISNNKNITIQVVDGVIAIKQDNKRLACAEKGCSKFAKIKEYCIMHSHQRECSSPRLSAQVKEPTMSPILPPKQNLKQKSAPTTRICKTPGCQSYARRFGRCSRHGGASICLVKGCTTPSQTGGKCRIHGGGSLCKIDNCQIFARLQGLCLEHYEASIKEAIKSS